MSGQSTAQNRDNKQYVVRAQVNAVASHLRRAGVESPEVVFTRTNAITATYPYVRWQQKEPRKISIIIPSQDHAQIIDTCLSTLFALTQYDDFEVVLVDSGSIEPETFEVYSSYRDQPFRVVRFSEPFNFGKVCNLGAHHATGDLLLFLNNDTEVLDGTWLDRMAQWFERDGVGIVGAKLVYPAGAIQHAGVIVGIGGLASHLFIGEPEDVSSMLGAADWYRNLMAVTGACLMISRQIFERVGGFDEAYKLNYSDIELCIRVYEAGYRIVYTPDARLIHHESVTHKGHIPRSDFERANAQWRHWLDAGDPYFNPSLAYTSSTPRLRRSQGETSEMANKHLMAVLPVKDIILLPDDVAAQ